MRKFYLYLFIGLILLVTGTLQVIEQSYLAVFPLFAGVVMIVRAYQWNNKR